MYNHLKERNLTISKILDEQIQNYHSGYREEFKLTIDHIKTKENEFYGGFIIDGFEFNLNYYLSGKLIGELTTAEYSSGNYLNLLDTIKNSYHQLIVLLDEELVKIKKLIKTSINHNSIGLPDEI